MTELKAFLASLYDSFSEAEIQALRHGQSRLATLLASGTVSQNVAVPVYNASDVEVTLDVRLVAEETEDGVEIFVAEGEAEDASELAFTVELFELLEKKDIEDLDYTDILPGPDGHDEERGNRGARRSTPPIDVIDAIDPQYRERLKAAGITHVAELTDRSAAEIANTVTGEGVDVSPDRAAEWLEEARGIVALLSEHETDLPVELIDGIGPTFGSRLREAGIEDLSALVELSPEEIAELVGTDEASVSPERTAEWLEQADAKLRALEEREEAVGENDSADVSTDTTDSTENER